jgi:hypothetical protein
VAFNVIGQGSAAHITGLLVKAVLLFALANSLDMNDWLSAGSTGSGAAT